MSAALVQGGVEKPKSIQPNRAVGPVETQGQIGKDTDLVKLAKTIEAAKTPHASQHAPGVALVVFADLDKESAKTAKKALAKLKEVNAKDSKVDVTKGRISVKLSGKGKKKLLPANVIAALKEAGVEASFNQ